MPSIPDYSAPAQTAYEAPAQTAYEKAGDLLNAQVRR
jgi:hypothetical protein